MIRLLPVLLVVLALVYYPQWWDYLRGTEYKGQGNVGAALEDPAREPTYGAIAMSTMSFAWGSTVEYKSKGDATHDAKRRCAESGAKDCEVKIWFFSSCAALAIKSPDKGDINGSWGTGRAGAKEQAEKIALDNCKKYTPEGCKIVESLCSP